jgi:hypothetical protein
LADRRKTTTKGRRKDDEMNDDEIMKELEGDPELAAIWRNASPEMPANIRRLQELSETMPDGDFVLMFAKLGRALRELRTGKARDDA